MLSSWREAAQCARCRERRRLAPAQRMCGTDVAAGVGKLSPGGTAEPPCPRKYLPRPLSPCRSLAPTWTGPELPSTDRDNSRASINNSIWPFLLPLQLFPGRRNGRAVGWCEGMQGGRYLRLAWPSWAGPAVAVWTAPSPRHHGRSLSKGRPDPTPLCLSRGQGSE